VYQIVKLPDIGYLGKMDNTNNIGYSVSDRISKKAIFLSWISELEGIPKVSSKKKAYKEKDRNFATMYKML